MPVGEANENKAKKLAAARKKLREYQKRGAASSDTSGGAAAAGVSTESHSSSIAGGSSISSNLSEASDCESTTNGIDLTNQIAIPCTAVAENVVATVLTKTTAATENETIAATKTTTSLSTTAPAPSSPTVASYFQTTPQDNVTTILDSFTMIPSTNTSFASPIDKTVNPVQQQNVNTIQVLINEKASLTTELNKYRCLCRERELETEELRTQLDSLTRHQDELLQRHQTQQQNIEQFRNINAELQHKLAQMNAKHEDQEAHMDELKRLLDVMQKRANEVEHQFKEKSNELEMAQLRIRQLSDEASVNQQIDNRVETLTQTQFMYEQQIRDLQAMVQQLTCDKEQANNQYQSYVQHLNAEVRTLNEKNSELMDESTKQQERERQLVDHISALEKDIQKNISRQDQLKKEKEQATITNTEAHIVELEKLREQIGDFDLERHEFQLKIKSQEDRLENLNSELQEKQMKLEQLEEYLQSYTSQQPDQAKLLATMESDKIAASRALTQNLDLKKQLDELEQRFVQLTNDKADLMNKLDAEEHANRKIRENYSAMEAQLHTIDERFRFKDEEMIRLSHENMELTNKAEILEKKLLRQQIRRDELNKEFAGTDDQTSEQRGHVEHENDHEYCDHEEQHDDEGTEHKHNGYEDENDHEHKHDHHEDHQHGDEHEHSQDHTHQHHDQKHDHRQKPLKKFSTSSSNTSAPHLPTDEAVEKLEKRFTLLMSQVADLTEEKQRLEHLVLQLQGETETIGEYITLYQTQRRMLKQREYEKAAQMQLLQREREQLRERIALLNNLVSSLSADLPHRPNIPQYFNAIPEEAEVVTHVDADTVPLVAEASEALEEEQTQTQLVQATHEKLTTDESRQILTKIQDIISEINENTQRIPDVSTAQMVNHLSCCLGKIEVV